MNLNKEKVNVAVVGATGLVGRTMLQVLKERNFPCGSVKALASARTAGQFVEFGSEKIIVEELISTSFDGVDIALFSAGSDVSRVFAPIAADAGCIVIDNGSYWRMHEDVPLCVPEVNPESIKSHKNIIANPNCSTIQLVLPLKALDEAFGLKRVVCSTYQSISGAGQKGLDQLDSEVSGEKTNCKHRIAFNTMFHSSYGDSEFTQEERKMFAETRKIMNNKDLRLAFTCVRLPVLGGHGESVNLELKSPFTLDGAKKVLSDFEGIVLVDDLANDIYPTAQLASGKDEVFVGRVRLDDSVENGLYLWISADNLRKGAATNAVQIAELLIDS